MAYATPTVIGAGDVSGFGYEEYGLLRAAIIAAVFDRATLGGSREIAIVGTGYQDAIAYVDFIVPDSASGGGVWKALVEVRTANAATTITPKIRDITAAGDLVVGSACAATTWGGTASYQTLTFTPVAGNRNRLMLVKSDDLYPCYGVGTVQRSNS